MLCLVGNAPSSGSTMFADLLDSTNHTACNPELELFCNKTIYDLERFKNNPSFYASSSTLQSTAVFLQIHKLKYYGFKNKFELLNFIRKHNSFNTFANNFSKKVLGARNKNKNGILFEKTPQNVSCIKEFLNNSEGHFIYLVRDPNYVLNSLLNRKIGRLTACSNWLINIAHIYSSLSHKRVHIIKYEDLVNNPFEITANLINKILCNKVVDKSELKENYMNNEFRRRNSSKKLKSWEIKDYGKITSANSKPLKNEVKTYNTKLINKKVSKLYSSYYKIPEISYQKALETFNYELCINENSSKNKIWPSYMDYNKITSKWIRECFLNLSYVNPKIFFNPIESI